MLGKNIFCLVNINIRDDKEQIFKLCTVFVSSSFKPCTLLILKSILYLTHILDCKEFATCPFGI